MQKICLMAGTFSQIYLHIVFAVSGRYNLLSRNIQEEVFKYISGIITNKGQKPIIVGGYTDHIHILVGIKPSCIISDLVRDIKNNSSGFINQKMDRLTRFSWQNGYGVFSCSHNQIDGIYNYIKNQAQHHDKNGFKQEYIELLNQNDVEFNDIYMIDNE